MSEFFLLGSGKSGDLEISLDHDNKNKVYMNIDMGAFYVYFLIETDNEEKMLKAIISYLKDDGEVVWKGSGQMTLGKFGQFRVELLKDTEFDDRITLLITGGNAKAAMRHDLDKETFMKACKGALEDL